MEKLIVHTVRFRTPMHTEFEPNHLGAAVAFAVEGMFENRFAIKNITDENGNELLSEDGIFDYADEHGL